MDRNDETKAVHSGETGHKYDGSVSLPIFTTSTFSFESSDAVDAYNRDPESRFLYTRYSNPTVAAVEKKIADLEGAEKSLLFSSGMAAITSTVLSLVKSGDRLVTTPSLYGGTRRFFRDILPRYGVEVLFAGGNTVDHVAPLLDGQTELLYLESPVNPHVEILDIRAFAGLAKQRNIMTMIDATFGTPYLFKPHNLGIDLVAHSCTKYLGGHADLIAGVVSGSREYLKAIGDYRKVLGGVIDPDCAYRVGRGLKTLAVRMEKHCANALAVAKATQHSQKIATVHYPGLDDSPWHRLAGEQLKGFGGVVCLSLKGGLAAAKKFVDSLTLIINAPSLGGVESLASIPALTSHVNMSDAEKKLAGVNDGMVRLSIGIEAAEDLIADVLQALDKV